MSKADQPSDNAGADPPSLRDATEGDYRVGYCRPPKHSRFQKGDGGNRKGRPKGRANFLTDLRAGLIETVEITKGGKPRKITVQQALVRALLAGASKNPRLAAILLDRIERLDASEAPAAESKLTPEEQAMLDAFISEQFQQEGN